MQLNSTSVDYFLTKPLIQSNLDAKNIEQKKTNCTLCDNNRIFDISSAQYSSQIGLGPERSSHKRLETVSLESNNGDCTKFVQANKIGIMRFPNFPHNPYF